MQQRILRLGLLLTLAACSTAHRGKSEEAARSDDDRDGEPSESADSDSSDATADDTEDATADADLSAMDSAVEASSSDSATLRRSSTRFHG